MPAMSQNKVGSMDEPIRARIITAVVFAVLCCTGIGMRVAFQKDAAAPGDAATQPSDNQEIRSDYKFSTRRLLTILDFQNLSVPSQRTLSLILLIPVGTLITAAYRRFIGMRTIGTFSPTLLALSQAKSDWKIGLLVFFTTFSIGILFRMLFTRLKLPAVSRRGIVAVFVVLFLAVAVSLCEVLNVPVDSRSVLLPVVVTTMMIERFFIIIGKEGSKAAGFALLNSLIVAVCCFGLFALTPIGAALLAYPELELLILSGLILNGCYSGPTLVGFLGLGKETIGETDD
jgi:hypothetical protein